MVVCGMARLFPNLLLIVLLLSGCSLFAPREPEAPIEDSGTYLQPDTPEQVVANVQAAIAELNTQNYRRSLGEDLTFEPTATAAAQSGIWSGWSRAEEAAYFSALTADAQFGAGHELALTDASLTPTTDETRWQYDAVYELTVQHRRSDVPTTVVGTLTWEIVQGIDGLWRIQRWTDRERGADPSWSQLKAAFF
jgi:Na+-transporting methylmalonyl-CoA/oxaloacetate decarboxylase gamma subunit